MSTEPIIKVNAESYISELNKFLPEIRHRISKDALTEGARWIVTLTRMRLRSELQNPSEKLNLKNIFKIELARPKNPNIAQVKVGISSREHGYKLRWLEWGTNQRETRERSDYHTGKRTPAANRGRVRGRGFFYGTIAQEEKKIFGIVGDSIIKSLENIKR